MKKALTEEELQEYPLQFKTRVETIRAEKISIKNQLTLNPQVEAANIHELFSFYDEAFFGGDLDGKLLLEWSSRMTQCAGICYL